MSDESNGDVQEKMPELSTIEMAEYQQQIVVLMSLAMVQLLMGGKFDKKDLAKDLNNLTQILAYNIARQNDQAELKEMT